MSASAKSTAPLVIQAQHTPLVIVSYPDERSVELKADGGSRLVATVHFNGGDRDAYANLFVAAPDLLAACASVWLMLADTGDNELRLIADECRAALAKAGL